MLRHGTPDTIAGWQALADGLLTNQSCVFHRNIEISSRYAWIYKLLPACFKWAGMAAFAPPTANNDIRPNVQPSVKIGLESDFMPELAGATQS